MAYLSTNFFVLVDRFSVYGRLTEVGTLGHGRLEGGFQPVFVYFFGYGVTPPRVVLRQRG
jgi:hypothetical protein